MLLIPCDTSECERVFSLMNDLKTSERTSMGQTTLKHLMVWYSLAKERKFEEVPVMAILKEFRAMADGVRGRKPHRGQQVPKYEYEKHRVPRSR